MGKVPTNGTNRRHVVRSQSIREASLHAIKRVLLEWGIGIIGFVVIVKRIAVHL